MVPGTNYAKGDAAAGNMRKALPITVKELRKLGNTTIHVAHSILKSAQPLNLSLTHAT